MRDMMDLGLHWRWWMIRDRMAQPFRVIKALAAEWRAPLRIVRCGECGFYFDAADRRGVVFEKREDDRRYGKRCPACHQEESAGSEAWALWNGCNGVFADTVRHSKAEAEQLHRDLGWGDIATVVPVRVFKEGEDRIWRREWEEKERDGGAPS